MRTKHMGVVMGTLLAVTAEQFGAGAIAQAAPVVDTTNRSPIEQSQIGDPMSFEPLTFLELTGEPMNISHGKIKVFGQGKVVKAPTQHSAWSDTWKVTGTGPVTVYASYELVRSYGDPDTHLVQEYAKFDSKDPQNVTRSCQVLKMDGTPDRDFPARCEALATKVGKVDYLLHLVP